MSRRLPLLIAFALSVCGSAHAKNPAGSVSDAEFPLYDRPVADVQRRGIAAATAAAALTREPDAVETLRLLLEQDRIDDAISVAERILARHPEQAAAAVKAIAAQNYRFRDAARGYPEASQRLADRARLILPSLPREDAARLARQIMFIEWRRKPTVPGANPAEDAEHEFTTEYAGTEEALLTEIDVIAYRTKLSWEQIGKLDTFARTHPRSVVGAKALFTEGWQLSSNIASNGIEPRGSDPTERFLRVVAIVKELESGVYPR